MGIEKVRLAICDTRGCGAKDFHQKDKLSPGWEWWHVKYPLVKGPRIKVAESHSFDMYLFCPKCSNSTEAPDV